MSETDHTAPDHTNPDDATPGAPATDLELLARARGGDDSAFAELWSQHEGFARSSAQSFTSSLDPDDLASEAFARIFERIRAGGGPTDSFRSYLYVSIRNLAAEWGRARREFTTDDEAFFESIEASDADPASDGERELMLRAFASLPTRWREALWYTEVEGLPRLEAAEKLDLKPNALAQLTFRAREGLRAAWIQEHIPTFAIGSDCRWAVERMGSYEREHLGKRDRARFESHVGGCSSCSQFVELAEEAGSRIRIILLPILLGGGYAAWEATRAPQGAMATPLEPGGATSAARLLQNAPVRFAATVLVAGAALVSMAGVAPTEAPTTGRAASASGPPSGPERLHEPRMRDDVLLSAVAEDPREAARSHPREAAEDASPPAPGLAPIGGSAISPPAGTVATQQAQSPQAPSPQAPSPQAPGTPELVVSIQRAGSQSFIPGGSTEVSPGVIELGLDTLVTTRQVTVVNSSTTDHAAPVLVRIRSLSPQSIITGVTGLAIVDDSDPRAVLVSIDAGLPSGGALTFTVEVTQRGLVYGGNTMRCDDKQPFSAALLDANGTEAASDSVNPPTTCEL